MIAEISMMTRMTPMIFGDASEKPKTNTTNAKRNACHSIGANWVRLSEVERDRVFKFEQEQDASETV